jgi:hypothetical protein
VAVEARFQAIRRHKIGVCHVATRCARTGESATTPHFVEEDDQAATRAGL